MFLPYKNPISFLSQENILGKNTGDAFCYDANHSVLLILQHMMWDALINNPENGPKL